MLQKMVSQSCFCSKFLSTVWKATDERCDFSVDSDMVLQSIKPFKWLVASFAFAMKWSLCGMNNDVSSDFWLESKDFAALRKWTAVNFSAMLTSLFLIIHWKEFLIIFIIKIIKVLLETECLLHWFYVEFLANCILIPLFRFKHQADFDFWKLIFKGWIRRIFEFFLQKMFISWGYIFFTNAVYKYPEDFKLFSQFYSQSSRFRNFSNKK